MTLIKRIESAQGADAELFWEAFNAAFPEPEPGCEPVWRPENPKQPIYHAWKTRQVTFRSFVDAEAWEQAAITLVPDGAGMEVKRYWIASADGPVWYAMVTTPSTDPNVIVGCDYIEVWDKPSAAIALCAAALRAREALA